MTNATEYTNGDLRVCHIQNPPSPATWYDVKSPSEGLGVMNELAKRDLRPSSGIHSNMIGLFTYEDGDWVDWYDDEGDDIDEWHEKGEA